MKRIKAKKASKSEEVQVFVREHVDLCRLGGTMAEAL
jgi:hypothetical protein